MKLDAGSYVVGVITPNGEYHVAVSKDVEVTGDADQAAPERAAGRDPRGAAPQGGTAGTAS